MTWSSAAARTRRPAASALVAAVLAPLVVLVPGGGALAAPTARPVSGPVEVHEVADVPADRVLRLTGRGFGHGRGMSQHGARAAAQAGASVSDVLSHYYPGTASERLDGSATVRVALTADQRETIASGSNRWQCDSSSSSAAVACTLDVLPGAGLAIRVGGGAAQTLPGASADGPVERWRVRVDAAGLHLQYLAAGAWRGSSATGGGSTGPVELAADGPVRVRFSDGSVRAYRGVVRAVRTGTTRMLRVNELDLDSYLRGVVPYEMPASWESAALQAQSVAARTYSRRYQLNRGLSADWHICDSTSCQVYRGTGGEHPRTDAAVAATAGEVRTHGGAPAFTEFSSASGGWSAPGAVPYLAEREDPWEHAAGTSNHRWTADLPAAALERRFPQVGALRRVVVTRRSGPGEWGGRVAQVRLEGSAGTVTTDGHEVRRAHAFPSASREAVRSDWWTVAGATSTPTAPGGAEPSPRPTAGGDLPADQGADGTDFPTGTPDDPDSLFPRYGDVPSLDDDPVDEPEAPGTAEPRVVRDHGPDRVSTSVALSRRVRDSAPAVVVVRGDDHADAVGAAGLAGALDAPVLLTGRDGLDRRVADEVRRLGASRAVVVGGRSALGDQVVDDLRAAGATTVDRASGRDRAATAAAVARMLDADEVFLVRGDGWQDAVAVGALAAHLGAPVLLTASQELSAPTRGYLAEARPARVTVVGGTAVVSPAVAQEAQVAAGAQVDRLSGPDRFATSAAVAERSLARGLTLASPRVATGWSFPDALAAGPAAAADGSLLLLVDGRDPAGSPATWALLTRAAGTGSRAVLVGGSSALGDSTAAAVEALLAG